MLLSQITQTHHVLYVNQVPLLRLKLRIVLWSSRSLKSTILLLLLLGPSQLEDLHLPLLHLADAFIQRDLQLKQDVFVILNISSPSPYK